MLIGVIKETKEFEHRVALSPDAVKLLKKKEFEVIIESGAGQSSYFSDQDYLDAGAKVGSTSEVFQADLLLKVNLFTLEEVAQMKDKSACISFMYAYQHPQIIEALNAKSITSISMDAVPRISRAQKMDALSSQANLAGYKAVLLGANHLGKIFPLMMTASGTITPAKVLIFGAGVAGLQAIATAKRLGAIVECTDVRPETKEQVESLGGRFLTVEGAAREQLGTLLAEAARLQDADAPQAAIDKAQNGPLRAPLVVVVIARLQEHFKVPKSEQLLAAACAAHGILLAAYAQGIGAVWRTGELSYSAHVAKGLGLTADEEVIGFLYLGTPQNPPRTAAKEDLTQFVSAWTGL